MEDGCVRGVQGVLTGGRSGRDNGGYRGIGIAGSDGGADIGRVLRGGSVEGEQFGIGVQCGKGWDC
jgi:hypothetical protein